MSDDLELLLRDTVRDLAAQARPANLAGAALRQGRRRARGRRLAIVGTAALTLLVLAAVPVAVSHLGAAPSPPGQGASSAPPSARPSPAGPTIGAGPVVLPGGWTVLAANKHLGVDAPESVVLDVRSGTYVVLPYYKAKPSPAGSLVAVDIDDAGGVGLLDLRDGSVRPVGRGEYEWSPDGGRLLLDGIEKVSGEFHAKILTVATDTSVEFVVDARAYPCTGWCDLHWMPSGQELSMPLADLQVLHDESLPDVVRAVQLFSAKDGRATREVPVPGVVAGAQSWSPDGEYAFIHGVTRLDDGNPQAEAQVVAVDSGQPQAAVVPGEPEPEDTYWTAPNRLLVVRHGTVDLVSFPGAVLSTTELPDWLAEYSHLVLAGP